MQVGLEFFPGLLEMVGVLGIFTILRVVLNVGSVES